LAWVWFALAVVAPRAGRAAVVAGTVNVTNGTLRDSIDLHPFYWKVENGVRPISPPLVDPRSEIIVAIDGLPDRVGARAPATTRLWLSGHRMQPSVDVVRVGGRIELRNEDVVPRTFFVDQEPGLLAPKQLAPRINFTFSITKPGSFVVRCDELPHVRANVLAMLSPVATRVGPDGGFRFEGIPTGDWTLKLWRRGQWIHSQRLEVKGPTTTVNVQVEAASASARAEGKR
jgi:hypothetical protein